METTFFLGTNLAFLNHSKKVYIYIFSGELKIISCDKRCKNTFLNLEIIVSPVTSRS